jgi:hypothetical protein
MIAQNTERKSEGGECGGVSVDGREGAPTTHNGHQIAGDGRQPTMGDDRAPRGVGARERPPVATSDDGRESPSIAEWLAQPLNRTCRFTPPEATAPTSGDDVSAAPSPITIDGSYQTGEGIDITPPSPRLDSLDVLPIGDKAAASAAVPLKLEKGGVTSHFENPTQPGVEVSRLKPAPRPKVLKQSELWRAQSLWKQTVIDKLHTIQRFDLTEKLVDCHTRTTYAVCNGCGTHRAFQNRCERFYCPECQPRLSQDRKTAVEWWTLRIGQPKHVVLTVKNSPVMSRDYVKWFKDKWAKLRRRKFASGWQGGFYSLEVTNTGNGWHLHLHALIDARWIDNRELAIQWGKLCGQDSAIVKVIDCRGSDYLREVTKYAVKGVDLAKWDPVDIAYFVDAFTGLRSFGVFGTLYGKRTEWKEFLASIKDSSGSCECGCDSWRYMAEWEWEISGETVAHCQLPNPPPSPRPSTTEMAFTSTIDRQQQYVAEW